MKTKRITVFLAGSIALTLMAFGFQNCSNAKFAIDGVMNNQTNSAAGGNDGSITVGNGNNGGNDGNIGAGGKPNSGGNDGNLGGSPFGGNDGNLGNGTLGGNDGNISPGSTTGGNDGNTTPATSININPVAVCGPAATSKSQSLLPTTSSVIAVLFASSNFATDTPGMGYSSPVTVVQAWDSAADVATITSELKALKPFKLPLNQTLAAGTYTVVMYDASKVSAPYSYDWHKSSAAVAPILDSMNGDLDYTSTFQIGSVGQQLSTQNLNVLTTTAPTDGACPLSMQTIDPLTINLSAQTVVLTAQKNGVQMDLDGAGTKQQVSWFTQPSVNMLLVNVSQGQPANGVVGPAQLFGNYTAGPDGKVAPNGYDALAKYDSNNDGVIDAKDPIWANLRVWQDLNHNGIVDNGELLTLAQVNITSIELPRTTSNHIVKENCTSDSYGNMFCYGRGAYINVSSSGKTSRRQVLDIGFKPL